MSDIASALLVLGFLIGLYVFMFRGVGGRVGRPPAGTLTRLMDPTSAPFASAALAAYALGSTYPDADPSGTTSTAVVIGVVVAAPLAFRLTRPFVLAAFSVVTGFLAVREALVFAFEGDDALATQYRIFLMLLLLASFFLAVVVLGHGKAAGRAGLGLFGLVELATFLAHPGNQDSLGLDPVSHLAFLGIVCVAAFVVGAFASEYVLGAIGVALVTLTYAQDAVVGNADKAWIGIVAAVTAAGLVIVFSNLGRKIGLG